MKKTITWNVVGRRAGKIVWSVVRFLLLFGLGYTLLSPFISMLSVAFRAEEDIWNPSVVWITRHFTTEHLSSVMETMDYWNTFARTMLIAVFSALAQAFTCALAGYGFARYNFKGKGLLFGIVILTIIVPPQVLMMPTYSLYRSLNLLDSVFAFWITAILGMGLRSGLFVFLYRQNFRSLPSDLEEAASIDGCGHIGIYFKIMLPNAVTTMITVFLFSFIWHCTDNFTTAILMPTKRVLTTALTRLNAQSASLISGGEQSTVSPLILHARMYCGAILVVIPLLIVFIVCQRYFRAGIERSGLVG